jgi:alpha-tubulin suppressor-like RCC1 family protein
MTVLPKKYRLTGMAIAVVASVVFAVGCREKGTDATEMPPVTINSSGGTVNGPDGASVVVPAGALAGSVAIQIDKSASGAPAIPSGVVAVGSIFALTPHGTAFLSPATIRIPFDTTRVAAGATPKLYKAEVGGSFAEIPATVDGAFLTAQVSNFSYAVPGLPGDVVFSQLSSTCGRDSLSGELYCWGAKGLLSDGSPSGGVWLVPTKIATRMFGSFAAGHGTVCGISNGFEVWCVGENTFGSLGDGSSAAFQATPVKAATPNGIGVLVAGSDTAGINDDFFCALVQDGDTTNPENGSVYCWGNNFFGELGIGLLGAVGGSRNVPTRVVSAANVRYGTLSAGRGFVCAVQVAPVNGAVDCWGENNDDQTGQSGGSTNGFVRFVLTPTTIPNLTLAVAGNSIAAGGKHACGLGVNNAPICWGNNESGQLGDGTQNTTTPAFKAPTPVAMPNGVTFNRIYAGGDNTCGLTTAGDAYCWGDNSFGQTGTGGIGGVILTPTKVPDITFKSLSLVNGGTVCGIGLDSTTYCWGRADRGRLGNGAVSGAPPVATPTRVTAPSNG